MKNYLKVILLISMIIFNTYNVKADTYKLYYFPVVNTNDTEKLKYIEYSLNEKISTIEKIYFLIESILKNDQNIANYIPEGSHILNITFKDGHLILNFNKNIKNYGGTFFELHFITQILENCFQFKNVFEVSFFIENHLQDLPEGSTIYKYTRKDIPIF